MTKGLKCALLVHGVGVLLAIVIAWFIPLLLGPMGITEQPDLYRWPLVVMALAWGGWTFVKILTGKDQKANKLIAFFDNSKPTVKS